ncbi:MAG: bifunctional phosphoribosyl-AMP cyclohydrolase/phosphoribosyl-ATP diphosphatase HisIE [Plesiomonas sp.]|uniref:bifunctional phosphoribosyl-AMP cyclohydrolase/phosphoribosyl-ATP diphosphatase HisIE n=1 Tax=Plesiomonas sp. TaxID=2486279 RepID=UPI003EE6FF7F
MLTEQQRASINWEKVNGLLPAIVQHAQNGQVLMLGYLNQEALEKTLETKQVTFFSRTKQRLWTKGETSGHILWATKMAIDCDNDTLLILAEPHGATCHLGTDSCFEDVAVEPDLIFLSKLEAQLMARKTVDPETSYTARLYAKGTKRIAQKVGEEGVETALAAVAGDKNELINESADLLYHLMVLLQDQDLQLRDVIKRLRERQR